MYILCIMYILNTKVYVYAAKLFKITNATPLKITTSMSFDIHNIFKKCCLLFGVSKTRYEELHARFSLARTQSHIHTGLQIHV